MSKESGMGHPLRLRLSGCHVREVPHTGAETWIIIKLTDKVKPFAGMVITQERDPVHFSGVLMRPVSAPV